MTLSNPPPDAVNDPVRVVIVDDTADVRMLLRLQLGFEDDIDVVGEAADGSEAPTAVILHEPDVVVMDVMMPVMDGITALPLVRDAAPNAKIIMYSSRVAAETERAAMDAGADAYLEKSTTPREVAAVIRRVAGRSGPDG